MAVINFILSPDIIGQKVGYSGCNHSELSINIQLVDGLITSKSIGVLWFLETGHQNRLKQSIKELL